MSLWIMLSNTSDCCHRETVLLDSWIAAIKPELFPALRTARCQQGQRWFNLLYKSYLEFDYTPN